MAIDLALIGKLAAPIPERAIQQGGVGTANFLVVLAQLGLLTLLLRQFQIESGAFIRLALLAFVGLAIRGVLRMRGTLQSRSRRTPC